MGLGQAGQRGRLKFLGRFLVSARHLEHEPQAVMGFGKIGFQPQRFLVGFDGRLDVAPRVLNRAHAVVRLHERRIEADGLLQFCHGGTPVLLRHERGPEIKVRLGDRGMESQGGPVFVDRAIGITQLKQCSAEDEPRLLRIRFDMQGLASLRQNFECCQGSLGRRRDRWWRRRRFAG